jgi:cytochrome c|tara:strand:+ start:4659 stop:5189 length:531 start_codon:yes stop_codon:yes gene_type:complete
MDSFEINKIITAVLLVVLLVFGIGKISDIIFEVKKPDIEGYKVEISSSDATTQTNTESQVDVAALLALGDIEHGKKIFKKCAACHSINQDGGNKIGPKLWNVMFRTIGSITDYKYSKALSGYKKEWSWEEINGFLTKPAKWIKGNKMGFAGLKADKDRASVILYLNQNSDNPKPLP